MAKINLNELDNYGGGEFSYFSLKNDKDTSQVRFMLNDINDVTAYAVHKINVNGRDRWVNCLRSYSEPLDMCPLCLARNTPQVRFIIPLYDVENQIIRFWERGKNFYSTLHTLCNEHNPLVSTIIEIERNGVAGDTNTKYECYEVSNDDTTLEDLPEIPDPVGTIILDEPYENLQNYVEVGTLDGKPPVQYNNYNNANNYNAPVRRRGTSTNTTTSSIPTRRRATSYNNQSNVTNNNNNANY